MPNLSSHKSQQYLRILNVGDPGEGKTSIVGKLAEQGERLFFADFDDGLDPLRHFLKPEALENVHYETLQDKVKFDDNGVGVASPPFAFATFIKLLKNWKDSETGEEFGRPEDWGDRSWLVVDTLTGMGNAVMWYTLHRNNRMGKPKRKKDWGDAIGRLEAFVQEIQPLPVNVIINAHLMRLDPGDEEEEEKPSKAEEPGTPQELAKPGIPWHVLMKRYPAALGQKLPAKIGGYFNVLVQTRKVGSGRNVKPVIRTTPDADVDVKVPVPAKQLQAEYGPDEFHRLIQTLRGT